ncbi:MAG TPA: EamA/RhaT family transporter, partial [Bacillota bacterium]|nr:EamA/RhaT family transporter [Bacillota bacterium]
LEPVLNPVWVFIFLGEKPGPWALVGGLVILITVTARCVIGEIQSHRR